MSHKKKPERQQPANPGYPPYPSDEDIYKKKEEAENIDPEQPGKKKKPLRRTADLPNEEPDEADDVMGDDLDVPGSELDDEDEEIGEEDEENNYYSLGGDKNPEDNRDQ